MRSIYAAVPISQSPNNSAAVTDPEGLPSTTRDLSRRIIRVKTRRTAPPTSSSCQDHGNHHGYRHGIEVADERRIGWAFIIISVFMVIEAAGGLISGSLALLADAGHMVSDAAALGLLGRAPDRQAAGRCLRKGAIIGAERRVKHYASSYR